MSIVSSLVLSATAQAASTITITTTPDPAESIATQLGITGTVAGPSTATVQLHVKAAGGSPCGANAAADAGGDEIVSNGFTPVGPYSFQVNHTFDPAGSYLLCAWIQDQGAATPTATAQQTIVVRAPHLSVTVAAPSTAVVNQTIQVSTTTQAEASRTVNVAAVPDTGRGCPANYAAVESVSGAQDIYGVGFIVGGPLTATTNVVFSTPGTRLLCGYFQHGGVVQAISPTLSIQVLAPCVVPAFSPGAVVAAVTATLAPAGCTVGKTRLVASQRYKRGTLVSLQPKAGTILAPQAAVTILVSDGAPCHVPHVVGKQLDAARRALAAAHCSAGKVHRQASRRRRGTVVRVSPSAGKRLAPRAKVSIFLSR